MSLPRNPIDNTRPRTASVIDNSTMSLGVRDNVRDRLRRFLDLPSSEINGTALRQQIAALQIGLQTQIDALDQKVGEIDIKFPTEAEIRAWVEAAIPDIDLEALRPRIDELMLRLGYLKDVSEAKFRAALAAILAMTPEQLLNLLNFSELWSGITNKILNSQMLLERLFAGILMKLGEIKGSFDFIRQEFNDSKAAFERLKTQIDTDQAALSTALADIDGSSALGGHPIVKASLKLVVVEGFLKGGHYSPRATWHQGWWENVVWNEDYDFIGLKPAISTFTGSLKTSMGDIGDGFQKLGDQFFTTGGTLGDTDISLASYFAWFGEQMKKLGLPWKLPALPTISIPVYAATPPAADGAPPAGDTPPAPPTPTTTQVYFVIIDNATATTTKTPINGVTVTLQHPTITTETFTVISGPPNSPGRVQYNTLKPNVIYKATMTAPGWITADLTLPATPAAGLSTNWGVAGLVKFNPNATIAGHASTQMGHAVAGATVRLTNTTTSTAYIATSDANGNFSATVPKGTYNISATHASYPAVSQTGIAITLDTPSVVIEFTAADPTFALYVTVKSMTTSALLSGATCRIGTVSAVTGNNGVAIMVGIAKSSSVSLGVSKTGYTAITYSFTTGSAASQSIEKLLRPSSTSGSSTPTAQDRYTRVV